MAYVHQLLDKPSQWQTSQQAGPGSVPKFTSSSITVKQLLIKNINQSKSSLLIWHYVSYLFLFLINIAHHDLINRYSAVESKKKTLPRISAFFNVKTSPRLSAKIH